MSITFYQSQLRNSLELVQWVCEQIPDEHLAEDPPPNFTEWSVKRHIYHLWVYEYYVTTMMRSWFADAELPSEEQIQEFNDLWQHQADHWNDLSFEDTLQKLITIREEQIALIAQYSDDDWQHKMPMTWGEVTLQWTVAKTIQHAMEHTDTLMKLLLWWETVL